MGRLFSVGSENATLGTGNVLIALRTAASPNAGSVLAIRRIEIGQSGSTTSGMVRGEVATRDTAGTLTLTSVTPSNLVLGGPASGLSGNVAPVGAAARIGTNSSADSGGTYTQRRPFNFNNLNGYLWVPTPEERKIVPSDSVFILRFLASPATTTGWTWSVEFEEII
jgi:hypothetical protein